TDHTITIPDTDAMTAVDLITLSEAGGSTEDNNVSGDLDVWMHPGTQLNIFATDWYWGAEIGAGLLEDRILDIHSQTDLHMAGITLSGGISDKDGGCLRMMHPSGANMDVLESRFIDCVALDNGGGAAVSGTVFGLWSTVEDSFATLDGGGLWVGGDLELLASNIQGNEAGNDGGGAHVSGNARLYEFSSIESNRAGENGGGLWIGGDLYMEQSEVLGNIVTYSGFESPLIGRYGGGVFVSGEQMNTRVEILRSTISGNFSGISSAMHIDGGTTPFTLQITNSTISMNEDRHPMTFAPAVGWYRLISASGEDEEARPGSVYVVQSTFVCNRNVDEPPKDGFSDPDLSGGFDLSTNIDLSGDACDIDKTLGIGYRGAGLPATPITKTYLSLYEDMLGAPSTSHGFNAIRSHVPAVTTHSTDALGSMVSGFGIIAPLAQPRRSMHVHSIVLNTNLHPAHDLVPCELSLAVDEDQVSRGPNPEPRPGTTLLMNERCDAGAFEIRSLSNP
ncbi:MAG: hypothetical protein AAFV53_34795, partial [Myxococcota bacterium]